MGGIKMRNVVLGVIIFAVEWAGSSRNRGEGDGWFVSVDVEIIECWLGFRYSKRQLCVIEGKQVRIH